VGGFVFFGFFFSFWGCGFFLFLCWGGLFFFFFWFWCGFLVSFLTGALSDLRFYLGCLQTPRSLFFLPFSCAAMRFVSSPSRGPPFRHSSTRRLPQSFHFFSFSSTPPAFLPRKVFQTRISRSKALPPPGERNMRVPPRRNHPIISLPDFHSRFHRSFFWPVDKRQTLPPPCSPSLRLDNPFFSSHRPRRLSFAAKLYAHSRIVLRLCSAVFLLREFFSLTGNEAALSF